MLSLCHTAQGITDLMAVLSWTNRTKFRNKYLNFLIGEGLLEMTIPDKPQSSLQRYRLTAKGKEWLEGQR
jgi:ATP-dependent DNA helicase RecG